MSAIVLPRHRTAAALGSLYLGAASLLPAHDLSSHGAHDTDRVAEAKLFIGRHGYQHAAIALATRLDDASTIGLNTHVVREGVGEEYFPSLGITYHRALAGDVELATSLFGYFEVEEERALGLTLRGTKNFHLGDDSGLSLFFSPAYARVRAIDEESESPEDVDHLLLLAGATWNKGAWELGIFGTRSFFSENPEGLESHVDLEEMTNLSAYENNDGFARYSVGASASYALTQRVSLAAKYAVLFYPEETRHSISLTPEIRLNECSTLFFGVQLLRGNGLENDLYVAGMTYGF
jgi:hypothetical protein